MKPCTCGTTAATNPVIHASHCPRSQDLYLRSQRPANPYAVVEGEEKSLTGQNFYVLDIRTGETLGGNLSERLAIEIATDEWAIEQGEE